MKTDREYVMYLYTPDEIDRQRAHHQAVIQGNDSLDVKRIGNLGELAFEQLCREYLPVETEYRGLSRKSPRLFLSISAESVRSERVLLPSNMKI